MHVDLQVDHTSKNRIEATNCEVTIFALFSAMRERKQSNMPSSSSVMWNSGVLTCFFGCILYAAIFLVKLGKWEWSWR